MRRFVSVFAPKREKQQKSVDGDPVAPKRAEVLSSTLPTPVLSDPAVSSASSSSGSASLYLQTPEDDHHQITIITQHGQQQQHPQTSKKFWKSWLKPPSVKHPPKHSEPPVPHWSSPPNSHPDDFDEHDESEDDVSDDEDGSVSMLPDVPPTLPPSPSRARSSFRNLIQNSLIPPNPPPGPFAQRSDTSHIFPRSCNRSQRLPRSNSLRSTVLKAHLLATFDSAVARTLTPEEHQSIASLASREISPTASTSAPTSSFNESALSNATVTSPSCRGLRRWISRPCFEDRYAIFVPGSTDVVVRQRVTGSTFAVAALEYSEAIDAMVDFDASEEEEIISPLLDPPLVINIPSQATEPSTALLSPPLSPQAPAPLSHSRSSPYIAVPSPLRNEHNSPPAILPDVQNLSRSAPSAAPTPAPTAPVEIPVKRGVRFQEDDKDDVIPLGYVLRMKKKREEKARFLRAENERRLLEEERLRMEEERRKQDLDRAEWERERLAWEKEKRQIEEERKQRKYAEEVVAARMRRESQRAGGVPSSNNGTGSFGGGGAGFFPASPSSASLRDSERNKPLPLRESRRQSRTATDATWSPPSSLPPIPRREISESNFAAVNNSNASVARSSPYSTSSPSPGSSRPPSIGGGQSSSPMASGSGSGTRPTSVYSSKEVSSSEDVRQQRAAAAAASMLSGKMRNPSAAYASPPYTMRSGSLQHLPNVGMGMIPTMPTMMPAFVMMDMPLLPPTPPFMLHQYPRQNSSHGSPAPSRSSSRGHLSSVNSSREHVNSSREHVSTTSQSRHHQHPRSASFPHRPEYVHSTTAPSSGSSSSRRQTHERRASEDMRRASMPVPPSSSQQQRLQQVSKHDRSPAMTRPQPMSRGASLQPMPPVPQVPSPWTGVPTQTGRLPAGMPVSQGRNGRKRQTLVT